MSKPDEMEFAPQIVDLIRSGADRDKSIECVAQAMRSFYAIGIADGTELAATIVNKAFGSVKFDS